MHHNVLVHELTATDLRRSRLHLFWIQLLFTVGCVGLLVSDTIVRELGEGPWRVRFPLGSLPYFASGFFVTVLSLLIVVWFVPRLALLWVVPASWTYSYSDTVHPALWRAAAVLAVVALLWLLWRARRAASRGPQRLPGGTRPYEESFAYRDERSGWLVVAAGLVVALILVVVHQVLVAGTAAFEARAVQETGVVVGCDEDAEELQVLVLLDDHEVAVDDPLTNDIAVGDTVDVLVDPDDDDHVVLTDDLADHAWLIGFAAMAPLGGLAFGLPHAVSARRRRRLVEEGAPAQRIRVVEGIDGLRILPMDGQWPFLEVADLEGIMPRDAVVDFTHGGDDEADDTEFDEDDDGLPADDAELAEWADEMRSAWFNEPPDVDHSELTESEKLLAQATDGPDLNGSEPFVLLGPWSQGSSVALVRETGQVWLAEIVEPRFRTGAMPVFWRGTAAMSGTSGGREDATSGLKAEVRAWAMRNYAWLRWVAFGALSGPFAWFIPWTVRDMVGDPDGFAWPLVVFMVAMAFLLPLLLLTDGLYENGRSRHGMITYGLLTDEVVAPDRFVSVAVGEVAVGLRLRAPDDVRAVFPEHVGRDLTPEQAADQVRAWFTEASPGSRGGRRPAPGTIVPVVMVLTWVVQLLPLLG